MSTTDRRATLRDTLIELAKETVARDGTSALKARTLATQAGCSVGSIYNVFGDMHDLVMAVNGETFRALGDSVTEAVAASAATDPTDRMITMAEAYLDFATRHPQLWRALFDIPITETSNLPDWYLEALDGLLAIIDAPVSDLFPGLPAEDVRLRTKALFSSIHGIVLLANEDQISPAGKENIMAMIGFIVRSIGK